MEIVNLGHVEISSCPSGQSNYLFMAFLLRCVFRQASESKVHIQAEGNVIDAFLGRKWKDVSQIKFRNSQQKDLGRYGLSK